MNDTSYDTSLYETYCKSYIIWSFTFPRDICLLCDNERGWGGGPIFMNY